MSLPRYLFNASCIVLALLAWSPYILRIVTPEHGQLVEAHLNQTISKPVSMLFIGDVMLGRNVDNLMKAHGTGYPFAKVDGLLAEPDVVVANLEGPIVKNYTQTPSGSLHFSFPSSTPKLLVQHHIAIVTLANNHTFDQGSAGYNETASLLDESGILHFGHPFAYGDQYVLRTEINGRKFTFIGFNATNPNFNVEGAKKFVASEVRTDETLIVAVHGGTEYQLHSNQYQENLYRGFIDNGAAMVIAHHPHVVEEIELYKGKPIFYSLGNFIFDQYFSKDVQQMLSVKMTFSDNQTKIQLIPLKSISSQPMLMSVSEKNAWLKQLALRSSPSIQKSIQNGELIITQ